MRVNPAPLVFVAAALASCGGTISSTSRTTDASVGAHPDAALSGETGAGPDGSDDASPVDASTNFASCDACTSSEYCYRNAYVVISPWDPADAGSADVVVPWDGGLYPDGCHAYDTGCVLQPTCDCELAALHNTCATGLLNCATGSSGQMLVMCVMGGGA
jgi:hypothetical protein